MHWQTNIGHDPMLTV